MWTAKVAHMYRLPVTTVAAWPHSDLVAAVTSLVDELERCPGCGLSEGDAWHVTADLSWCPTCADRDRQLKKLHDLSDAGGWRARFRQLTTEPELMLESSAVRYTPEGAAARKRWRETQPARPQNVD